MDGSFTKLWHWEFHYNYVNWKKMLKTAQFLASIWNLLNLLRNSRVNLMFCFKSFWNSFIWHFVIFKLLLFLGHNLSIYVKKNVIYQDFFKAYKHFNIPLLRSRRCSKLIYDTSYTSQLMSLNFKYTVKEADVKLC